MQIYTMNFFSHYLDKETNDPWFLFGILLPELLPHFNEKLRKAVNIYAEKDTNKIHQSIYKGVQRHYEVDRLFHNSDFFKQHTAYIKNLVLKNNQLEPLHYRTFFLAHVWLELLTDRILIKNETLAEPAAFYRFLESLELNIIGQYFTALEKQHIFLEFTDIWNFHKQKKFLFGYIDNEKFIRALLRLYSNINPSIFDMNENIEFSKLLLISEQELQHEIQKFVNEFKISLKQTTC
jgi:hypothetical protein